MESALGVGDGGGSSGLVLETVSKCLQIVSVGFNGAIIYTIWRKSLMRIPSTRFVFSLCLSHLLVSLIGFVISIISFISSLDKPGLILSEMDESQPFCMENPSSILNQVLIYITFGVAISTLITVTLISIERFITIARPMKYKSIVTPRRCFMAISLSWILSALLVVFPVIFFNKYNLKQCGSSPSLIPVGHMGWYFAVVFTILTILALTVMTVCYLHIFTIAKEKCQKVQIGQFSASAPGSISSDWASSVHSSVRGQTNPQDRGWFHSGSRMTSSNSLLHWVLMANLRHHANPIRLSSTPKSPDISPTGSVKSEPDQIINKSPGGSSRDPRLSRAKRKWRKYLQQNYNSPRKTVCTILVLIGSVILTQLPMSFVLFFHLDQNPLLFYFCHDILFALSSVANPILYGFLNRNIRDQLWKIFRPQKRRRNRQKRANSVSVNQSVVGELRDIFTPKTERIAMNSRKGSLSSEDSNTSNGSAGTVAAKMTVPCPGPTPTSSTKRRDTFIGLDDLSRFKLRLTIKRPEIGQFHSTHIRKISEGQEVDLEIEEVSVRKGVEGNGEGTQNRIVVEEEVLQNLGFPRKPSQDSGADMTFSDEDQEQEDQEEVLRDKNKNMNVLNHKEPEDLKKVENYLRIYGDFFEKKRNPKSKSDSDILNAPGLRDSLPKSKEIIIKSQCQLGPEMLHLDRRLALEPFRPQARLPLSSSRQNLLLGVHTSNGCNNCYSDGDELLQSASAMRSSYDGGERDKDNGQKVMCTDLIKIGRTFHETVSNFGSSDSGSSSCTTDSDEDEEVKDHIEI